MAEAVATTPATTATAGADVPEVTLYWLDKSRSQRILWLLEECKGVTYKVEVFKRTKEKLAPPELKQIHPLGKSPVIQVKASSTAEPITLAESGTMTEYLSGYFAPHLIPKRYKAGQEGKVGGETEEYLRYTQLMHYAEGSLMAILVVGLIMNEIRDAPGVPFFAKPIPRLIASKVDEAFLNENYKRHFTYLETLLKTTPGGGKYICGAALTNADILLSFPLIASRARMGLKEKYPTLDAYTERISQEPGYLKSVKKIEEITGEPFQVNM